MSRVLYIVITLVGKLLAFVAAHLAPLTFLLIVGLAVWAYHRYPPQLVRMQRAAYLQRPGFFVRNRLRLSPATVRRSYAQGYGTEPLPAGAPEQVGFVVQRQLAWMLPTAWPSVVALLDAVEQAAELLVLAREVAASSAAPAEARVLAQRYPPLIQHTLDDLAHLADRIAEAARRTETQPDALATVEVRLVRLANRLGTEQKRLQVAVATHDDALDLLDAYWQATQEGLDTLYPSNSR